MDQSARNRLIKRQTALLLASSDMDQAIAAARALGSESDGLLARALETAIAVSYMRPFTGRPPHRLPDEYVPSSEDHSLLEDLRHKVYAHTDKASGRTTSVEAAARDGEIVSIQFREPWQPLPREILPRLIQHFEAQRERFRTEAASIHVQLHGLGHYRATP